MSLPLTPFERWLSGTNQNSIPANNNSLRAEIFNTDGIADDVTAQPGSPADGDWYIIPSGATGTQWATFAEDSVAIFYGGTWYEFVPVPGNRVGVAGVLMTYSGSAWVPLTVPAAIGDYTINTEASAFTADPATHAGLNVYNRCGGDVEFDSAEGYSTGQAYNIRSTASISLVGSGVTLTPPAGGTLDLDADMAVQVLMTSSTTADVIGQTVAAP